ARSLKATTLARLLRYEDAEMTVLDLLKDRPRHTEWHRQLVDLALYRGDFEGAVPRLKELIALEKQKSSANDLTEELIQVLLWAEQAEEAVGIAKRWHEDAPEENYRRDLYLQVLSAADRDDESVNTARGWLDDDPASPVLRRYLRQRLMAAERYAEAQQVILQWLVDDPGDDALTVGLLQSLWATKDWESALDIARCSAEAPEKSDAYTSMLGQTLLLAGRYDKAIDHYHSTINDLQESRELRLNNQNLRRQYRSLIGALILAERYDEAETVIRNLPPALVLQQTLRGRRGPAVNEYVRFLVEICQRTDREDLAIRYLEDMHKSDPKNPGMCNDLGYTWVDAGRRLEEAEKLIRIAVAAQPRNAAFLDSLGWVRYKRGSMDEAVKYLELALRHLRRDDEVMRDHLGDAYYRSDRMDEARSNWEKALGRLAELEESGLSLDGEQRKLRENITMKLEQLGRGAPVDTAPIGEKPAATSRSAA
ncbi:MAG: tetratricopeptide repeat protein, partial [Planctomycetota bacterium]|nr:tetratricopeptide repeat protein [Planctomycetota bacterium]